MEFLRDLALKVDPVWPGDIGDLVFERFERSPDLPLIAVVDAYAQPVGLIERSSFLTKLASQYGRAVYGKRPIALLMNAAPLLVEADSSTGDFAQQALQDHSGDLRQGFIVIHNGRYLGVGVLLDLLKAAVKERTLTARHMGELADSLRESNLEGERQRRFAEAVIEHIPSLVTVRSATTGRFVLANHATTAVLGIDRGELVGRTVDELALIKPAVELRQLYAALDRLPPTTQQDLPFDQPGHDDTRVLRATQIPLAMPEADPVILTVADDVTEAQRAATKIEQLAHFDMLTGLPNRAQFQDHLDLVMRRAGTPAGGASQQRVGMLIIDLDRFKSVNDTYGHSAGDILLREVANRLRRVVRSDDLPSRLGGDEFAILVNGANAESAAELIAERLIELLSHPFRLAEHTVYLGGSVGIAFYPDDASTAEELVRHADIALYRAKGEGKGAWHRFNPEMQADMHQRTKLERELHQALENGEFEAHFQPILAVAENRIIGFEALMRWHHPVRGYIPPDTFIPVAEDIGLIGPLGDWMIREVCRIGTQLPDELTVAINISAVQFRLPGFVSSVMSALGHSGLSAHRLEIEITESVLVHDEAQVLKSIRQLRELGVRIALDDFGTGYASLAYLQRFPFDKIKIDQSFIRGLPDDKASVAIISAVTALADQLGLITTAEGVETEEERAAVTRLGCTEIQGYLIGRPTANPLEFHIPGEAHHRSAA